jgi:ArsR family transcriptional regulator
MNDKEVPMKPTSRMPAPARPGGRFSRADRELATLARALGHPARVAILRLLAARGECVCGSIVDQLPLAQATVSQHLKVLKQAGLIQGEVEGPRICYCVQPEALARLRHRIGEL